MSGSPNLEPDSPAPLREYVGMIWIGDKPARRLQVWAANSSDARRRVIEEYGDGHVISIWNDADASRTR